MKKIVVNTGRDDAKFNIEKIEAKYNAKWVGQLCLRVRGGGWHGDDCGDVYYQETPPVEGYSNYFALIMQFGNAYITSGASGVEGVITGIIADDGEVIYSRYRHDYRTSTDGSVFIDGGRDYVHCAAGGKTISLKIRDGEWYQLEDGDMPELLDNDNNLG